MSPEERYWRERAAFYRRPLPDSQIAQRCELMADLVALESLSLAEVESLQRLCRRDCPDALAAEGRG